MILIILVLIIFQIRPAFLGMWKYAYVDPKREYVRSWKRDKIIYFNRGIAPPI